MNTSLDQSLQEIFMIIESDGKIWLNDDDTSVRVGESTVSIKKGGESETEDYALLEDIEKWYGRIKELSGK